MPSPHKNHNNVFVGSTKRGERMSTAIVFFIGLLMGASIGAVAMALAILSTSSDKYLFARTDEAHTGHLSGVSRRPKRRPLK